MNELSSALGELIGKMESAMGKEKSKEIIDFGHRTEDMLKNHSAIGMLWMLGLAVCSTASGLIDLLYNATGSGALMYRSALEKVAPELVEKVDAKFFENEGGEADGG